MIKKVAIFVVMLATVMGDAVAAPAQRRGGAPAANNAAAAKSSATTARAAVRAPNANANKATTKNTNSATTARAAVRGPAAQKTTATQSASAPKAVAARAATQKALATGTKISAAAKNTLVNSECQEKYNGCMDSFCMLENASGGRCICSDKHKEYDSLLSEIDKLNQQSYTLATVGVEQIELGSSAEAVIAKTKSVASSFNEEKKKGLNLDLWEKDTTKSEKLSTSLTDMKGDDLFAMAQQMCVERIPECEKDISMLTMMYNRQITSDCAAYENSLKESKNASTEKVAAAERAMRDAALEQMQSANKWDLGQCALEYKKCLQTTAGCGTDFSGCASVVASDSLNINKSTTKKRTSRTHLIQGDKSNIEISVATWDALVAKKPLCDSVTKNCEQVASLVWDVVIKDIAPQVRAAELIAEDKSRQDCVSGIVNCFHNACKENIDPNDPDGSYDMCLTRPETMLTVCKIPLNACGIKADNLEKAEESPVWEYVMARLSSMRVDSCTIAVKDCLQDTTRCGKDYGGCIGLDLVTVRDMCPVDKLVACQQDGVKLKTLSDIDNIILGLYLNIDNAMLSQCQNAVSSKIMEICGDSYGCNVWESDATIGTDSLYTKRDAEGNFIIGGLLSISNVSITPREVMDTDGRFVSMEYDVNYPKLEDVMTASPEDGRRIESALESLRQEVARRMQILATDPTISMCIYGRDMSQIRGDVYGRDLQTTGRFPHLLYSYANIMSNAILETAKENYDTKFAKLYSDAIVDSDTLKNTVYCNAMAMGGDNGTKNTMKNSGVLSTTDYKIVIAGANDDVIYEAIKGTPYRDEVVTDIHGSMVAKRIMRSTYEPGSKTCTIITETSPCLGTEAIYEAGSSAFAASASVSVMGFGGSASYSQSQSSTEFKGAFCKEFAEPIVSEQVVHFAAGSQNERMITTRSNLTSKTVQNVTTTNVTNKSTSIGLSASMGDIGGNHSVTNVEHADSVQAAGDANIKNSANTNAAGDANIRNSANTSAAGDANIRNSRRTNTGGGKKKGGGE